MTRRGAPEGVDNNPPDSRNQDSKNPCPICGEIIACSQIPDHIVAEHEAKHDA